jgi:hypothetical protein
MEDTATIIRAIKDVYQKDTFTVRELTDILTESGFKTFEARQIIRQCLNKKEAGRISYRRCRRNIPPKNTRIFIGKPQDQD